MMCRVATSPLSCALAGGDAAPKDVAFVVCLALICQLSISPCFRSLGIDCFLACVQGRHRIASHGCLVVAGSTENCTGFFFWFACHCCFSSRWWWPSQPAIQSLRAVAGFPRSDQQNVEGGRSTSWRLLVCPSDWLRVDSVTRLQTLAA